MSISRLRITTKLYEQPPQSELVCKAMCWLRAQPLQASQAFLSAAFLSARLSSEAPQASPRMLRKHTFIDILPGSKESVEMPGDTTTGPNPGALKIRLLYLLPSSHILSNLVSSNLEKEHHLVQCELRSTTLDSAPPYTALSYTWGTPSNQSTIILNGRPAQVTANSEIALRQLQKGLRNRKALWIDALCINQQDDDEKSEQVRHLRHIFSRAEAVVAWLGPANETSGSNIAMRWIQTFGERAWKLGIGSTPAMQLGNLLCQMGSSCSSKPRIDLTFSDLDRFLFDLKAELDPETNPNYETLIDCLQEVLSRAFWSRIWVVQEVAVAGSVSFTCGDLAVNEHCLHHAFRLLRNFYKWQLLNLKLDSPLHQLRERDPAPRAGLLATDPTQPINLLTIRRQNKPLEMMSLLRRTYGFDATDPRDRIFALMGIAADTEVLGLQVNYGKTTAQVYTETARCLLQNGFFDILSHDTRTTTKMSLPSWVRDWCIQPSYMPLQSRAIDRSTIPPT